jgi:hypothetical protein
MHHMQFAEARGPALIAMFRATCVQIVSGGGVTNRDGNAKAGHEDRNVKHVGGGACSYS